jgi:hypothetical protein
MANQTVAAVFDRYDDAAAAVSKLEAAGVAHSDISIVSNDAAQRDRYGSGPSAATGAGTGATVGTVVGGGAGILAGLGMLAIPGLGPVVAAGWLVSALVGAGAGAAAGGILGSLTGAGVSETDAHSYAEAVHRGGTLVTVRADEANHDRVVSILDADGAVDLGERESAWRSEGWTGRHEVDAPNGGLRGVAPLPGSDVAGLAENSPGVDSPVGVKLGGPGAGADRYPEDTRDIDALSGRSRVRSYPQ